MKSAYKKLIFTLLALCLTLACATVAFAAENESIVNTLPSQTVYNPVYEGLVPADTTVHADRYYDSDETNAQIEAKCITSYKALLENFRAGLENRQATIALYYSAKDQIPLDFHIRVMNDVVAETDVPTQGDYLEYSWYNYEFHHTKTFKSSSSGRYCYKFIFKVQYYTTKAQEDALTAEINRVLDSFHFTASTTNLQKIRTIYDYITTNIRYDKANLNDDSYLLKYTAYAALMHKTAVCQGYAVLFYRMAEAVGVDTRVIVGTGNGGGHAWNIVKVGDRYYYLDSTWDAGWKNYGYNYYLRGTSDFSDHQDGEKFTTAEFKARYPIPTSCYSASSNYNPDVENRIFTSSDVTLEYTQTPATGKAIQPGVTVKYNQTTLVENQDYIVKYANNTSLGTATVTVKGMGRYTGSSVQKTFQIIPASENLVKNLTASYPAYGKVKLSWSATAWVNSGVDAKGYNIYYKKASDSQYIKLRSLSSSATTCTIEKLSKGVSYRFMVAKYVVSNGQTHVADQGMAITVTTPGTLTKVTNLKATLKNGTEAAVSWNAVPTAHGYKLYYKVGSGSWTLLKCSNAAATTCNITGLSANKTYTFKVLPYHVINGQETVFKESPTVSVKTLAKYAFVTEGSKTYYYVDGKKATTTGFVTVNSKSYYVVKGVLQKTTGVKKIGSTYYYLKDGCKKHTFKDLSAPKTVTAKLTLYNRVKVSWSKVSGATHYRVYYKNSKASAYKLLTTTSALSYTKTKLSQNAGYYFKIVPCTKVDGALYADSSYKLALVYTTKNLSAPKTVTAKLYGHDDIKVSWSKVSGAIRYKVYYRKSTAKSYTLKTTATKTSYSFSNLEDGVKYYFKIVPCVYVTGGYLADDSYKTATETTLKKVKLSAVTKADSKKVTVKWTNIAGESGYQISKSTSKTKTSIVSTYSTTSGKSKTVSTTKGKTYYYKVRAYCVVDGKKIYGPWSAVKAYKLK